MLACQILEKTHIERSEFDPVPAIVVRVQGMGSGWVGSEKQDPGIGCENARGLVVRMAHHALLAQRENSCFLRMWDVCRVIVSESIDSEMQGDL